MLVPKQGFWYYGGTDYFYKIVTGIFVTKGFMLLKSYLVCAGVYSLTFIWNLVSFKYHTVAFGSSIDFQTKNVVVCLPICLLFVDRLPIQS